MFFWFLTRRDPQNTALISCESTPHNSNWKAERDRDRARGFGFGLYLQLQLELGLGHYADATPRVPPLDACNAQQQS